MSATAISVAERPYSRRYTTWMLSLLVLSYASSFLDRVIVATVGQALKIDLRLTDTELGLLGGLAFALFYTLLGMPVARLADRYNRVSLVATCIAVWSLTTMFCGMAQNFGQLLLCRVGVGIGEAGCTPASHSLIADHYPPEKRATALGIFALGVPLGVLVGGYAAGWLTQHLGWRSAFIWIGFPGILLALLVRLTLHEPARGGFEATGASREIPPFMDIVRRLLSLQSFRRLIVGAGLQSLGSFGISLFIPVLFMRVYHMEFAQAGLLFGLITGLSGLIGNAAGGYLSDWAGRRDARWYLWVPAIGFFLVSPLYIFGVMQDDWMIAAPILLVSSIFMFLSYPSTFAVTHRFVAPRARATASAVMLLVISLVGQGLGPLLIGYASDRFAKHTFAGDYASVCPAGMAAKGADSAVVAACSAASASGVRYATAVCSLVFILAGLYYVFAARTLRAETPDAVSR